MPINHAKRREHNGSRSYEHVIRVITYRHAKTVSPKLIIIITFLLTFREAGRSSTRKHDYSDRKKKKINNVVNRSSTRIRCRDLLYRSRNFVSMVWFFLANRPGEENTHLQISLGIPGRLLRTARDGNDRC